MANPNFPSKDQTIIDVLGDEPEEVEVNIDDFIMVVDEEVQAKMDAETKAASKSQSNWFRWPDNARQCILRILPGRREWGSLFVVSKAHWFTKEGKRLPTPCLVDSGFGCPHCDVVNDMAQLPNGAELADKAKTQIQFLYNIIDTGDTDAGVQVYGSSKTVHDAIQLALANKYDLLGETTGLPIIVGKEVKGGTTSYKVMPAPKAFPVPRQMLAKLNNLPLIGKPPADLQKAARIAAEARQAMGLPPAGMTFQALPSMGGRGKPAGPGLMGQVGKKPNQ